MWGRLESALCYQTSYLLSYHVRRLVAHDLQGWFDESLSDQYVNQHGDDPEKNQKSLWEGCLWTWGPEVLDWQALAPSLSEDPDIWEIIPDLRYRKTPEPDRSSRCLWSFLAEGAPARHVCVFLPAMLQQPARLTDDCTKIQDDAKATRRQISVTASSSGLLGVDCPPTGSQRYRKFLWCLWFLNGDDVWTKMRFLQRLWCKLSVCWPVWFHKTESLPSVIPKQVIYPKLLKHQSETKLFSPTVKQTANAQVIFGRMSERSGANV